MRPSITCTEQTKVAGKFLEPCCHVINETYVCNICLYIYIYIYIVPQPPVQPSSSRICVFRSRLKHHPALTKAVARQHHNTSNHAAPRFEMGWDCVQRFRYPSVIHIFATVQASLPITEQQRGLLVQSPWMAQDRGQSCVQGLAIIILQCWG